MVRFYHAIALLLFLSLSTYAQSKSAITALQKAKESFRNGEAEKGWQYLEKSMKKGKDSYYQAFIFAADQCFREGKYELALEYYDESLAIDAISTTYLKKSLANKYL